jgi:hypothetical protein
MLSKFCILFGGLMACLLGAVPSAQAAVTNVRLYDLGEADLGAAPGLPGDAQTVDSAAGFNASKVGLTTYYGAPLGLAPGSSLAMEFTNIDSRYEAPAVPSLIDNFGIEAYVQATTPADARFFYNGGAADPSAIPADGAGLEIQGGKYVGVLGGVGLVPTGVAVIPGTPVEMALVESNGIATVYINDVPVNSLVLSPLPALATDSLVLGDFVGNQSAPAYAGVVDEARIFTFPAGGFDAATDLGAAAVPEPSSLALLGVSAIGLLGYVWRRKAKG